jgi:hypothetical protein
LPVISDEDAEKSYRRLISSKKAIMPARYAILSDNFNKINVKHVVAM